MSNADESPTTTNDRWKLIRRQFGALGQQFSTAVKIDLQKPDGLAKLDQFLAKLPPGDALAASVEQLRLETQSLMDDERQRRTENFGRFEREFIDGARATMPVRERSKGWQIGPVTLELRRDSAQGRALYNGSELSAWQAVGSAGDLQAVLDNARKKLDGARINDGRFRDMLLRAFDRALQESGSADPRTRVAVRDVYRHLRLQMLSDELASKPDRKLVSEFPQWAFVYNLDHYRDASGDDTARLHFETGSQAEQRTLGFSLNGLSPTDETRTFCYLRRAG